jgi:hypothetical protein
MYWQEVLVKEFKPAFQGLLASSLQVETFMFLLGHQ